MQNALPSQLVNTIRGESERLIIRENYNHFYHKKKRRQKNGKCRKIMQKKEKKEKKLFRDVQGNWQIKKYTCIRDDRDFPQRNAFISWMI